jgi:membrane associated rhomboid family serine protease
LATAIFLHFGLIHLLTNMLYLGVFGGRVESALGPSRFLVLYLSAGVCAGLALVTTAVSATPLAIGSSGAVAGIIGGYVSLYPYALLAGLAPRALRVRPDWVALSLIGLWLLVQLIQGLQALGSGTIWGADDASWAHVGGFAAGAILGPMLRMREVRVAPLSRI